MVACLLTIVPRRAALLYCPRLASAMHELRHSAVINPACLLLSVVPGFHPGLFDEPQNFRYIKSQKTRFFGLPHSICNAPLTVKLCFLYLWWSQVFARDAPTSCTTLLSSGSSSVCATRSCARSFAIVARAWTLCSRYWGRVSSSVCSFSCVLLVTKDTAVERSNASFYALGYRCLRTE